MARAYWELDYMLIDASNEAGAPAGQGQLGDHSGAHLFAATAEGVLEAAGRLLERDQRFVIVARTLPAAVRLRETLAPTAVFDEAGLPIAHPVDGRVALYRAQEPAPRRRALLQEHAGGRISGLILTAGDLAAPGTLEAFGALEPAFWLVDDAHCLSLSSAGFVPALRQLEAVHARGLARALWLFAPFARTALVAELRQLFGIEEANIHRGPLRFPESVGLSLQLEPRALFDRNLLSAALRRHVPAGAQPRGVIVAPLGSDAPAGALPVAELESVVGEVGAEPVRDPGEGLEAQAEGWAALYRRPHGIVLTENPEAIEVLSSGSTGLVLRLIAPASPETVLEECLLLARQGGGHWGYLGPAEGQAAETLELDVLEQLGRWLAEAVGEGRVVALDAQEVASALAIPLTSGLERFSRALEQALNELVGVGVLASAREARFQLEVAESHRFSSPHIDSDPRYVELKTRYEAALARMGMLQSVKYRLNALPPKDLRVLAGFLEYPVSVLNVLFDDLASEGVIICRQVVSGAPGNRNFEVTGQGDREAMLARLPEALRRITGRRQRAQGERDVVARLVSGTEDAVPALMAALEVDGPVAPVGSVLPEVTAARPKARTMDGAPAKAEVPAGKTRAEVPVPVMEGGGAMATRGTPREKLAARRSAAQGRFEELLAAGEAPLRTDEVSALLELADGLQADGLVGSSLATLEARLVEQESPRLRAFQVLLLQLSGDGEAAGLTLSRWLGSPLEPGVREAWLPVLLSGVDYRFELAGQTHVGGIPGPVREVAMLLPAIEGLPAAQAVELVRQSGFTGDVTLGELGSSTVLFEDMRYTLERQSTPPEVEAALWLAVEALESAAIPGELARARVAAGYLMVAGLADEELTRALAGRVLAGAELPAWIGGERRRLAQARIFLTDGRVQEALEVLQGASIDTGMSHEIGRLKADALLKVGEPLAALCTLAAAGVNAARGEGQALWQAVNTALMKTCEAHAACDGCPLLNTDFCPAADSYWSFVEHNPYNEVRRAIRTRIEKRSAHGLQLDGPQRLAWLMERFSGHWNEALVRGWIASAPAGRPEEWLLLAQRLIEAGTPGLALQAAERVQASTEDTRALVSLSRIRLAGGDLAGGLELAQRAAQAGGRAWDEAAFCRELDHRLGRGWEGRVEALTADLTADAGAHLTRLAEGSRSRAALQAQRKALEAATRSGSWRELREALTAFRELAGEGAEREPAVREAQSRLTERQRRVALRVDQILAGPPTPAARAELTRLVEESEQLGMDELTNRAREALATPAQEPAAAEAAPQRGPGGISRPESERGRPERGGERRPGGKERRDGRHGELAGRPARGAVSPGTRGEGAPGLRGEARAEARGEGQTQTERPKSERAPREGGAREARRAPALMEESAILQALKDARGDRERVSVVMPAVYEWLAVEPERGIKLLRDALPLFQYQDALDRPIAEVIREGRPEDGALPRLRRVLEKDSRSFSSALGELSTRENPEPWKRVLGQLKLKS